MEEKDIHSNYHRIAFVVPCVLYPYVILLFLYLLMGETELFGKLFNNDGFLGIGILILFLAVACIFALVAAMYGIFHEWDSLFCSKMVLAVKLLHIPAYIIIFLLGIMFSVMIFTFVISFLFIIFDVILITVTGMLGTTAAIRAYKEGKCSLKWAIFLSVCQYIFCIDVFVSLYLFCMVRENNMAEVEN